MKEKKEVKEEIRDLFVQIGLETIKRERGLN